MMARVRNKDSKAELTVRRRLHALGYRYRVHHRITGKPDIAFTRLKVAIFIDGDMWHGNAWRLRGLPDLAAMYPNRTEWWVAKIERNMARDEEVNAALNAAGWIVLRFWESDVKADLDQVVADIKVTIEERRRLLDHSSSRTS
jgi:DNA mismatch endonuclease (patch repair protein)